MRKDKLSRREMIRNSALAGVGISLFGGRITAAENSEQIPPRRVAPLPLGRRRLGELWRPGQISRYSDAIGRSHGRIHFAGEHTTKTFRGMEAAMESGDAASEILARM